MQILVVEFAQMLQRFAREIHLNHAARLQMQL
jgi:hypothetical protein